jgi:hypothetical protein
MGNYFEYSIDIAVVAKHSLDEDLVMLVERHYLELN